MKNKKGKTDLTICPTCGEKRSVSDMIPGELIRPSIRSYINKFFPDWTSDQKICINDLIRFRAEYVSEILRKDTGELSLLDESLVNHIKNQVSVVKETAESQQTRLTFGDMVADAMAKFGGSWSFIICFASIIFVWIIFNSIKFLDRPFDPYPYILLNLVLSCLAALQAPIIMMSQNRQEERDRNRSESDYLINLKAELEVRQLHEKLDHIQTHQWQRLLEIQQIQTDLMTELLQLRRFHEKSEKNV
ncbi:MAG: DUF1003 domain-containing protein [Oligoflexales bacterium]|nr:DUF1003 domain-containing protein [Oligoflexales bacterium]